MSWASLGHNDVTRRFHHRYSVGVEKLSVAFTTLSELEFEVAFLVEDLNSVVIGVGNNDVVLSVHGHARRLSELTFHDAELAEFAVIYHFLTLQLRFQWIGWRLSKLRS